jgi:pyridoxamine 5'-phosphate oxidase
MSLIDKDHGYHGPLIREGMKSNPIEEFAVWMSHLAIQETFMSLSTVSKEGKPSCRNVGYGGLYNDESIVFTTDATSRKGTQFKNNPNVALTFCFQELNLQIRIEGVVKELPNELFERLMNCLRNFFTVSQGLITVSQGIIS